MIKLIPAVALVLLATCTATASAAYPSDENGRIAYSKNVGGNVFRLHVIEPDGTGVTPVTGHQGQDFNPSWSPDGSKLAYASRQAQTDDLEIRVHDFTTGEDEAVTDTAASENEPTWSPDGTKLAYSRGGSIWVMNADGSDQHAVTTHTADQQPAWNPADPDRIAFVSGREASEPGEKDLWEVNLIDGHVSPLSRNADDESNPSWSPAGDRLIFAREIVEDQGANVEIYSLVPASAQQRLTNAAGTDYDPAFSPDGTKIVFRTTRDGVFALWTMGAFGAGPAKLADEMPFAPDWGGRATPPPPPPDDEEEPADEQESGREPEQPRQDEPRPEDPAPVVAPSKAGPMPKAVTVRRCVSRRTFRIHVWRHGIVKVTVVLNGKRIPMVKRGRWTGRVDLRGLPKGRFSVKLTMTRRDGKVIREVRRYRTCG